MLPRQWLWEFLSRPHSLAAQFITPDLKTPEIAEPHVLVPGAASIGLVRFAHQATGAGGFGTFAFVMHGDAPRSAKSLNQGRGEPPSALS